MFPTKYYGHEHHLKKTNTLLGCDLIPVSAINISAFVSNQVNLIKDKHIYINKIKPNELFSIHIVLFVLSTRTHV